MSEWSPEFIYYWPDGTWCYAQEYCEVVYAFKGDDYGILEVDPEEDEPAISRAVDALVNPV